MNQETRNEPLTGTGQRLTVGSQFVEISTLNEIGVLTFWHDFDTPIL